SCNSKTSGSARATHHSTFSSLAFNEFTFHVATRIPRKRIPVAEDAERRRGHREEFGVLPPHAHGPTRASKTGTLAPETKKSPLRPPLLLGALGDRFLLSGRDREVDGAEGGVAVVHEVVGDVVAGFERPVGRAVHGGLVDGDGARFRHR